MSLSTCDLCDQHPEAVRVADPLFRDFGGRHAFGGRIVTIKCHEDNSLVRDLVAEPGQGCVLVIDGGGARRLAAPFAARRPARRKGGRQRLGRHRGVRRGA